MDYDYFIYITHEDKLAIANYCDWYEYNLLRGKNGDKVFFRTIDEVKEFLYENIKDEYIDKTDTDFWPFEQHSKYYKD